MKKKQVSIPSDFRLYFWDTSIKNIDLRKHQIYVIERLLEYGNEKAVRWMFKHFRRRTIMETLKKSRVLSQRTANFWAMFFGLNKKEVLCLTPQFQKIQRLFWPY
ncbi:MAG: hypothetical protein AB1393_00910 [Candidatus Edwardsbacteria bacterium]